MRIEFQDGDSIATVLQHGVIGYTAELTLTAREAAKDVVTVSIVGAFHHRGTLCVQDADEDGGPAGNQREIKLNDIEVLSIT